MHTMDYRDENGREWYFHHNGDFSGNVVVSFPDDAKTEENVIVIPFVAMKLLVGQMLQNKFMAEIEDMDGSDFIDIELSTVGIAQISNATLAIYGRSYNTTASGSFNWQTFDGTGSTDTDFVSNVAPYQWYTADMTTEISPGDDGVYLRIKSGPSSDALVVNRIELCLVAQ